MPRRARRNIESCYLHVIVQGIEKKYIFAQENYKEKYKSLMLDKSPYFDVKILSYCIMGNHAHILLFSENIEMLGKYMQVINTAYAHFYNKQKNRVGYVFRNRYLSEAIRSESQLYNCLTYIHYNPVKAQIVDLPSQYKYSSYMEYKNNNGIVDSTTLKLIFGSIVQYMDIFDFIHFFAGEGIEASDESKCDINFDAKEIDKLENLKEKCRKLKEKKFSNRKIAEILNINRNKINQVMKELCQ